MIVALAVTTRCEFHPVGPSPAPPPYTGSITWWHWQCTICGAQSRPRALFSHERDALQMGERHADREQCRDGQLALFALS
jgi:hypothetical protein